MSVCKRLSICYAAPGQNLRPSAGPTRNVLNLAHMLSEWADVTVAFRSILEPTDARRFQTIEIDPAPAHLMEHGDDNATRGLRPIRHLSYCRRLWSFARQHARSFDVVLEKGWRLSGLLSAAFRAHGVPCVLVENDVRLWTEPLKDLATVGKFILHTTAELVARCATRRLPAIIAETDDLKSVLIWRRGILADRIHVIGLGVDHTLFYPREQRSARESLGVDSERLVLMYVGAMDEYHDLRPVIEALGEARCRSIELHVVGDGEYRARYEALARDRAINCRFHGRVSYESVARYIAAADLCIAPYRTSAFPDGLVYFSSLKIPEYMACARPVVAVPGSAARRLVHDGASGFLLQNERVAWQSLLQTLPSREWLACMGRVAARAVEHVAWERTAREYLDVSKSVMSCCAVRPMTYSVQPGSVRSSRTR